MTARRCAATSIRAARRLGVVALLAAAAASAAGDRAQARPAGASGDVTGAGSDAARAARPVTLRARLGRGARLGGDAAVRLRLEIDPARPPATTVRLAYPDGLGVVSSGLGLEPCQRSTADFTAVVIDGTGLAGCPRNAVLGRGRVRGRAFFGDFTTLELGRITLLSGPLSRGRLQLVAMIDAERPIGTKLAYAGELSGARGPYGGEIAMHIPPIPSLPPGSTVALQRVALTIGDARLVYVDRTRGRATRYRPGGIGIPPRCPRVGFPFRARVTFADGSHARAVTRARCPRR